jgi:hypothetical protein
VEVTDGKLRNPRSHPGGVWCDGSNTVPLITDHLYDCGPAEETGGPCIAGENTFRPYSGSAACGQPRNRHAATEYDTQASRYEEPPNPGDMHEPDGYPFELDWYDSQAQPSFD